MQREMIKVECTRGSLVYFYYGNIPTNAPVITAVSIRQSNKKETMIIPKLTTRVTGKTKRMDVELENSNIGILVKKSYITT